MGSHGSGTMRHLVTLSCDLVYLLLYIHSRAPAHRMVPSISMNSGQPTPAACPKACLLQDSRSFLNVNCHTLFTGKAVALMFSGSVCVGSGVPFPPLLSLLGLYVEAWVQLSQFFSRGVGKVESLGSALIFLSTEGFLLHNSCHLNELCFLLALHITSVFWYSLCMLESWLQLPFSWFPSHLSQLPYSSNKKGDQRSCGFSPIIISQGQRGTCALSVSV